MLVLRAAHMLLDGTPKILDDPVSVRLLDAPTRDWIVAHPERFAAGASWSMRGHVVVRSRFAEEALERTVADGVRQLVVLGAGYDTFAFRQPGWASALRIFEVDHPASQESKRQVLSAASVPVPPNVTFAPIDFEHETLADGLARAGYDPAVPTFISCLGVLVYLTSEAVESVFRFAASMPRRSVIVCTVRLRRPEDDGMGPVGAGAAALGEPWLSDFDPAELVTALDALGLRDVSLTPGSELEARYAADRQDGLKPPRRMTMLTAKSG